MVPEIEELGGGGGEAWEIKGGGGGGEVWETKGGGSEEGETKGGEVLTVAS